VGLNIDNYFFYNINTMAIYHIYIFVAFILGVSIKLYDDFKDFDNLEIPTIYTDILKMLVLVLNTIITLYDYRFSFIPISAVLASYIADKLKDTFVNEFVNKSLEKSIKYFKSTFIWNTLNPNVKQMINNKSNMGNYNDYKNAINDNFWDVYMIAGFIIMIFSIILNPSQFGYQLINLINFITIGLCVGFNIVEPYIFPEENSIEKIYGRSFFTLFVIGIILFGNYFIPFFDINYIISYSVLGYISTSVISMYTFRFKTNDKLKEISKTI
jgi:hypothetical protein